MRERLCSKELDDGEVAFLSARSHYCDDPLLLGNMSILRPGCEDHHHERRRQPSSRSFPEADRESGGCMVINSFRPQTLAFWNICGIGVFAQAGPDSVG